MDMRFREGDVDADIDIVKVGTGTPLLCNSSIFGD